MNIAEFQNSLESEIFYASSAYKTYSSVQVFVHDPNDYASVCKVIGVKYVDGNIYLDIEPGERR